MVKLLLKKLTDLFPDIKYVRVNIEGIETFDLSALDNLELKGAVLEKYNSSKLKTATTTNPPNADLIEEIEEIESDHTIIPQELEPKPEPQNQYTATKQGDTIYMGDAKGNEAENNGDVTEFSMEEAGEVISRPQELSKTALSIRTSSRQINPNFVQSAVNTLPVVNNSNVLSSTNLNSNTTNVNNSNVNNASSVSVNGVIEHKFPDNLQNIWNMALNDPNWMSTLQKKLSEINSSNNALMGVGQ
jgi:hypothetical protein